MNIKKMAFGKEKRRKEKDEKKRSNEIDQKNDLPLTPSLMGRGKNVRYEKIPIKNHINPHKNTRFPASSLGTVNIKP
jgi:hypothetical protein